MSVLKSQVYPPTVQLLPQHGCPAPPQSPVVPAQEPLWHVVVLSQALPFATHRLPPQQPPLLHPPSAQQGWSGPPHAWHVMPLPAYQQTCAVELQELPAQHG
jgi:hypothetical protein